MQKQISVLRNWLLVPLFRRKNSQVGKIYSFSNHRRSQKRQINIESASDTDNRTFIGSPSVVKDKLKPLLDKVVPEELKIITICEPLSAKEESYHLINGIFNS